MFKQRGDLMIWNMMDFCPFKNGFTQPAVEKLHLKMASAEVVCCLEMLTLRTNLCIQINSVDPDQTAPRRAV